MKKESIKTSFQAVRVSELRLDKYQRALNMPKVKEFAAKFDATQLGTVTVSKRNGQLYIVDGQHRVVLAKMVKLTDLMAIVYEGLTYEEEAELFNKLNGANGEKTRLKKSDIFNANVEAKDDKALEIKNITEGLGFRISQASGANCLVAINAIYKIYNKYGATHLYNTLKLIKDTWFGETDSLNNLMLTGVSEFVKIYSEEIDYSERTFINQLSKVTARKVIADSKDDKSTNKIAVRTMNALLLYYNKGLRTKKLENKHFVM